MQNDPLPEVGNPIPEPPTPIIIPDTDQERAKAFLEYLDDDFLFIYSWKTWAVWDGEAWRLDLTGRQEAQILCEAQTFVDGLKEEALSLPPDTPESRRALSAVRSAQSYDHMKAMINIVRTRPDIRKAPTDFDADPWVLGVQNGVVNLKTGEFRAVKKEDLMLKKCGVAYDKDATCPMWLEFLEQVLPDSAVREYVARAIGYALTGLTTEQVLFFFYGMGQNGKSTFIDTVEKLLGDYSWRTSAELFIESRGGENKMHMLSALPEMRFVVGAEMPEHAHLAENRIKDLTGGDKIQARKLFCEPFNYTPTHKLFFYGNHRPMVRGTDQGIWRRINLVPFTVEIPEDKRDRNIVARLWSEASGILNWAIGGCLEWQQHKLSAPEAVRYATDEYREAEDLIGQYLEAETQPGGEVSFHDLSSNFVLWAKSYGYKVAPSPRAVTDRAGRIPGIARRKSGGNWIWVGLSMKDPAAFRNKA